MGTLHIVATPLGNLEDITIRAIKTLFGVDGIACEDTRKTSLLLRELAKRYPELAISKTGERSQRLLSLYEENEMHRIPEVINALKNGLNIALASDAGTPMISDPGFRLVRDCIRQGIEVDSLPGPSAATLALTLSGLPTDKYLFLGYPPRKKGHRIKFFESALESQKSMSTTMILYEAPHRLLATLNELQEVFGDIYLAVCREMTKAFQEIRREKISDSVKHFQSKAPKGEFVLVLNTHLDRGII